MSIFSRWLRPLKQTMNYSYKADIHQKNFSQLSDCSVKTILPPPFSKLNAKPILGNTITQEKAATTHVISRFFNSSPNGLFRSFESSNLLGGNQGLGIQFQVQSFLGIFSVRTKVRDTFPNPSEYKRIRKHGWRKRMSTRAGRLIIMNRILRHRHILSH